MYDTATLSGFSVDSIPISSFSYLKTTRFSSIDTEVDLFDVEYTLLYEPEPNNSFPIYIFLDFGDNSSSS